MKAKVLAGTLAAFGYNSLLADIPSRTLRHAYLRYWLSRFGHGSAVQRGCVFLNGRKIELGERNIINFGCLLDGRIYKIITGSDVSIGPNASILTLGHDPQAPDFANKGGDVTIGDRVWICFGAVVLPGITLGEGCVVAAGAVVTKDVAPFTIVGGNPARQIGERSRELRYHLSFSPWLI